MIGTLLNYETDYPDGVELLWPPVASDASHLAIIEWLKAEGLDPDRINRAEFVVERMPDGTVRIVFREFTEDPPRLHSCAEQGCHDAHYGKTDLQYRVMATPPPVG